METLTARLQRQRVVTPRARLRARLEVAAVVIVIALTEFASPTAGARWDTTAVTAQQATELITRSTVQILAFGCDLQREEGSAVVIGSGRIITNDHVVGASRLIDVVASGMPLTVGSASSATGSADLASVSVPGLDLPALALAPDNALVGSTVRLAGFPGAPPGQRESGLVISEERVVDYVPGPPLGEPGRVMRLSGPAQPGMSGGPVLDDAGHLAGIVFGNEVATGRALALPASLLRKLLTTSGSFAPSAC
ncbi:MAG: serine protease [Acidimicrobiales bacterium]